jgi:DNA-binding response OmpR family regulator
MRGSVDVVLVALNGDGRRAADAIRSVKSTYTLDSTPVLILGPEDELSELISFALGADDYVHEPHSPQLLAARIRALVRRRVAADPPQAASSGPVHLNLHTREVQVHGEATRLTKTEFRILSELVGARGRVVTRRHLSDVVFQSQYESRDRRLDVHISNLRQKLASADGWLQTIRGEGFAWREPLDQSSG